MIHISKLTGKIFHHDDCTYCVFRLNVPYNDGKKKRTYELCQFTKKRCVPVGDINRHCEHYRQINCSCQTCLQKDLTNVE